MKKLFSSLTLVSLLLGLGSMTLPAYAQETEQVLISAFVIDTCPHCQDEEEFLEKLSGERTDFEVKYYHLEEKESRELFVAVAEKAELPKATPITLIGNTIIQGFGTEETTGEIFKELINKAKVTGNLTFEEYLEKGGAGVYGDPASFCDEEGLEPCEATTSVEDIDLPLIGTLKVNEYSLFTLSAILGTVDGFNPCAMFVLLAFLVALLATGSRKKMFQVGGLFLIAEALMYYAILTFWYTAWDFIGLDQIVTPSVGILALVSGSYFLYRFAAAKNICNVTGFEKQAKIEQKIQSVATRSFGLATALIIIGIAFSVNIIEFACSIGIPQAFTKILEMNNLSFMGRNFYMFIYIIGYMVDDLIVFGLALWAKGKIPHTEKYTHASYLIGGVILLLLGLAMIFNPSLLTL